ncbi:hypothetical protein G5V57_26080 [Nordella sp. HKS 07]|uniref:hypothetical protein n=1 Tax=Nordella sp. HKS 07 TaxID=2712222 RepID=UPI0013E14C6C|nr:hypothetical protein [Nordella sp. HKS 07]QIG50895.1 hypothetical protein G5V57_26080 [Nordella sp. HKS 07]
MTQPLKRKASNLEREVINAVMILYALITIAMLAIHYLQPAGRAAGTSSTSPAHQSPRSPEIPPVQAQ